MQAYKYRQGSVLTDSDRLTNRQKTTNLEAYWQMETEWQTERHDNRQICLWWWQTCSKLKGQTRDLSVQRVCPGVHGQTQQNNPSQAKAPQGLNCKFLSGVTICKTIFLKIGPPAAPALTYPSWTNATQCNTTITTKWHSRSNALVHAPPLQGFLLGALNRYLGVHHSQVSSPQDCQLRWQGFKS